MIPESSVRLQMLYYPLLFLFNYNMALSGVIFSQLFLSLASEILKNAIRKTPNIMRSLPQNTVYQFYPIYNMYYVFCSFMYSWPLYDPPSIAKNRFKGTATLAILPIFKNVLCHRPITFCGERVMSVKVYIFGKEITHRIYLWPWIINP